MSNQEVVAIFVAAAIFMACLTIGVSLAARAIAQAIRQKSAFWYALGAGIFLAVPAATMLPKWWFV